MLLRGFALRGVLRFAPSRVDGRAQYVNRLPAIIHPDKQSNAVGQAHEHFVKDEACVLDHFRFSFLRGGQWSPINIEALCAAPPGACAHSPSQMPLSCPVAPPSQRQLHKDGGGGGAERVPLGRPFVMSAH